MNEMLRRRAMMINDPKIITSASSPIIMKVLYDRGYSTRADYMLKSEAEALTGVLYLRTNGDFIGANLDFTALRFFTSIDTFAVSSAWGYAERLDVILPHNITKFGNSEIHWYRVRKANILVEGDNVVQSIPNVMSVQSNFRFFVEPNIRAAYEAKWGQYSTVTIFDSSDWDNRDNL